MKYWYVENEDLDHKLTVKELEYTRLQDSMDKELLELNERLEQKEVLWRRTHVWFGLPSFVY